MSDNEVTARSLISRELAGVRPYDQAQKILDRLEENGYQVVNFDTDPEPDRLDYFAVTGVRFRGAESVRDPQDPFLRLGLLSTSAPPAELRLSFGAALELIERIAQELAGRTRRWDIHEAVSWSKPLPLKEGSS
jgi:hypothetical protein